MSNMAKKITSFNIDKAISRISRLSVFDRIVNEIETTEIPSCFIESIIVQYHDGNIVELRGDELKHPIPMNKNALRGILEDMFKGVKDIRVFINTDILETSINEKVEDILGKYC